MVLLLRGAPSNPSQRLSCQCVTFVICIYLFCFYNRVSVFLRYERSDYTLPPVLTAFTLPSCPLLYSLPCRNQVHPHQKHTRGLFTKYSQSDMFMVEVGRFELPSRTLFFLLHTTITTIIYL